MQNSPVDPSPRPTHARLAESALGLAVLGGLGLASFWIMRPFLLSLIWAATIVVTTWPILLAAERRLGGRRSAAAALMTLGLLFVFLLPLGLAIGAVASNYDAMAGLLKSAQGMTVPAAPQWLANLPLVGDHLTALWNEFSAAGPAALLPYAKRALEWLAGHIGNVGNVLLHIAFTAVISGILYAQGDQAAAGIMRFFHRLAGERGERSVVLAAQAVRGVALGVEVTAAAQSALGGIGLALTGVPFAGPLGLLMFVLCLAQLGPILVLAPAIVWMYWSGDSAWATVLLVITVVASTMDNVLRPYLIRKGADLPLLLIFAGVIGGLIGFGLVGLFVGPVVLAVTYRIVEEWVAEGAAPAAQPAAPAARRKNHRATER